MHNHQQKFLFSQTHFHQASKILQQISSVSKCFKSETATFGAKTRQNPPQKFLPKNHLNFRPNRHNFRNFEVEKLNFLQIPLMFTEKCENIAFFLPAPKNFFRHKKVPNRQKPANPPLLPTLFIYVKLSILFINSAVAIFLSEKIAKSKLNLPNLVVLVTPIDVN